MLFSIFQVRFGCCSKPRSLERGSDNSSCGDLKSLSSYPDGVYVISPDINTGLKLRSVARRLMDSYNKAIGYDEEF